MGKKIDEFFQRSVTNKLSLPSQFLNDLEIELKNVNKFLLDKDLDADFVKFQREDSSYAAKYLALLYLKNYERKFDEKSGEEIPNGNKFTIEEKKNLENFIENKTELNDENLFKHAFFIKNL